MLRPRIVPCLLVHQGGLVKTTAFKDPKYVGDPINAVKIFNEKEADELMVLDIDASVEGREPDYALIANLAAECQMPLSYGGGIKTPEQAQKIIALGVEKVCISSAALQDPTLISRTAEAVGSQSVVAVLDVRKKRGLFANGLELCWHNAKKPSKIEPLAFAHIMQEAGAGEIVFNSVDRDGAMQGYDVAFAAQMRQALRIPLTFLGGAGTLQDLQILVQHCGVVGAAAGSLFVFKGQYRAVLISYPNAAQKDSICAAAYTQQLK